MDILISLLGLLENSAIQAVIVTLFGLIPIIGGYSFIVRGIWKAVPHIKNLVEQVAKEQEKDGKPVTGQAKRAIFDQEIRKEAGAVGRVVLNIPQVRNQVERRLKSALGEDAKVEAVTRRLFAAPSKGNLFD